MGSYASQVDTYIPNPASAGTYWHVSEIHLRTYDQNNQGWLVRTDEVTVNGRKFETKYYRKNGSVQERVTVTSPALRESSIQFDDYKRPTVATAPGVEPRIFGYNVNVPYARGRSTSVSQGDQYASWTFDSLGRTDSKTDSAWRQLQIERDPAGRPTLVTGPLGSALEQSTEFGYDVAGNLTALTPPEKETHHFGYTADNEEASYSPPVPELVVPPDPNAINPYRTEKEYDEASRLWQVHRPGYNATIMTYGGSSSQPAVANGSAGRGKLQKIQYDGYDGTTEYLVFEYDQNSKKLKRITDGQASGTTMEFSSAGPLPLSVSWGGAVMNASISFDYNDDLQLKSETVGASSVGYLYETGSGTDGLLKTVTTAHGEVELTRRPVDGFVSDESHKMGNVTKATTTLTPDTMGRLLSQSVQYGDLASGQEYFTTNVLLRDALGRILKKQEKVFDGNALQTHTYVYRYDDLGRLTKVWVDPANTTTPAEPPNREYGYDANGNRISYAENGTQVIGSSEIQVDQQDRLVNYGAVTYAHSMSGERTVRTTPTQDTLYKYDALSHLRQVELPAINGTHPVIQYEYDQLGRRISRSMTGPNAEPTRKWVYRDGLRIAAELDSGDNVVSRFVYSAGRMPVQMIRGNTAYLLVTDYLGSLRAVVRLSDGEIMQRMEYDEFGRVIADDVVNGFERVPFGYAGGLYDRGTGLVRFGARDYDAEAGRWVSKDPVGLNAGSNVYSYVNGDPINWVDPWGLAAGDPYFSPQDAAWAAAYEANPYTAEFGVEFTSFIYQAGDGSYSYSTLVEGGARGGDFDPSTLPLDRIAVNAIFHTHPDDSGFSSKATNPGRSNDELALEVWAGRLYSPTLGSYVSTRAGVLGYQEISEGIVGNTTYFPAESALNCSGWQRQSP